MPSTDITEIQSRMRRLRWTTFVLVVLAYALSFFHRMAPATIGRRPAADLCRQRAMLGGISGDLLLYLHAHADPDRVLADTRAARILTLGGIIAGAGSLMFGLAGVGHHARHRAACWSVSRRIGHLHRPCSSCTPPGSNDRPLRHLHWPVDPARQFRRGDGRRAARLGAASTSVAAALRNHRVLSLTLGVAQLGLTLVAGQHPDRCRPPSMR